MKEKLLDGFKFISEEEWYSIFRKYDCSVPCESNSLYEERMVNMYNCYDATDNVDKLEDEAENIMDEIKRSIYSQYIENIKYDMDYECRIRFIDIFLVEDIKPNIFEEILKYLRDNF